MEGKNSMMNFIVGFITAYVLEAAILWWGWKYSERQDQKRAQDLVKLDPQYGRERFYERNN